MDRSAGTPVTISGTDFTPDSTVMFGTTPAVPGSVTVVSTTEITATSPAAAGAGTVPITVTTPGGPSTGGPEFNYVSAPAVTNVSPNAGPLGSGTKATITGTGFTDATQVDFGPGNPATFTVVSDIKITATAPGAPDGSAGTVHVTVTTGEGGQSSTSSADTYTYDPIPTVTGVSPNAGPIVGGNTVTITGTGFTNGSVVDFGPGNPASSVTVGSGGTSITATAPSAPSGSATTVDVTVSTPGGTSPTSSADSFTYTKAPIVSSISPGAGPLGGGNAVTITGANFTTTATTTVFFGTSRSSLINVNVATQTITASAPGGSGGNRRCHCFHPGGTSSSTIADKYTYDPVPTVSSVSPNAGPLAGGTSVKIMGTGFTSGSTVAFGSKAATSVTFNSVSSITATAPAGAAGAVDVTVTTPGGTSGMSNVDKFIYETIPTVTSVSASAGPLAGGNTVTITGTNFTTGATVAFGGSPAGRLRSSTTQITATVPLRVPRPGRRDRHDPRRHLCDLERRPVHVRPIPAVTGVSPSAGATSGGMTITISGSGFTAGSTVMVGGSPATSVVVRSSSSITATVPAGAVGTVDVTVTTPGGTSAGAAGDHFSYLAVSSPKTTTPSVSSVAPAAGPVGGGTKVTIAGSAFTGATAVDFGSTPAASFAVVSDTEITAVSPARAVGPVNVTVTTAGGQSPSASGAVFTYAPSPTVIAVRVGSVKTAGSQLAATVDAGGVALTGCSFEFGRTSHYGTRVPCTTGGATSNGLTSVTANLFGLSPATTYHYRIDVTTSAGAIDSGDAHFTTLQLPLLEAPLVGLVVQRSVSGAGAIGRLLGIQGIQHGVSGETITIRCIKACSRRSLLTLKHLKPPLARLKVMFSHSLSLSKATRLEIEVSRTGHLGRFAVYAFAPSGTSIAVQLVQTGCLASNGHAVSCTAPKAAADERRVSSADRAEREVASDVIGVRIEP